MDSDLFLNLETSILNCVWGTEDTTTLYRTRKGEFSVRDSDGSIFRVRNSKIVVDLFKRWAIPGLFWLDFRLSQIAIGRICSV